jgi:hypothetical protein
MKLTRYQVRAHRADLGRWAEPKLEDRRGPQTAWRPQGQFRLTKVQYWRRCFDG